MGFPTFVVIHLRLDPLKRGECARPGDIIWTEGHVLALSDGDCVVAAERYSAGFGGVFRTPISRRFGGLRTVKDLERAYFDKEPVCLLDIEGQPFSIKDFKIFKLPSVTTD
ncbi:MAG: hypothetical protein UW09_C0004G0009 [candidate division TM6 bacterium GW2011_GWF2_43_87]|nr:MAG: hypothetical protein UW09_C0004G0009 [candidate division TM6 bacterium GW2011_GWF2_43_87]